MKKWLGIVARVLVWLVLMGTYFNAFVMSDNAPFELDTDWFSSPIRIEPCGGNPLVGCANMELPIAYTSRGFPILMYGGETDGPYALVWAINIGFAILVGVTIALILMGLFNKAAIAGGILVLTYGLLAVIVSLF